MVQFSREWPIYTSWSTENRSVFNPCCTELVQHSHSPSIHWPFAHLVPCKHIHIQQTICSYIVITTCTRYHNITLRIVGSTLKDMNFCSRWRWIDSFHSFIMYLECPVSAPLSPEINYHLFSFIHIQVMVWLITSFCKVIEGGALHLYKVYILIFETISATDCNSLNYII